MLIKNKVDLIKTQNVSEAENINKCMEKHPMNHQLLFHHGNIKNRFP